MKSNDFMILYVLVCGFLIGTVIYGAFFSKGKTYPIKQAPTESMYDSQFNSFEWRSHKYLKYSGYDTHYDTHVFNALLHDPDCPCITNNLMRLYQAISTK